MLSNPVIFYGLIFAAALLVIDTVLRLIGRSRRKSSDVRNRIETLRASKGVEDAYGTLLKQRGIAGRGGEQDIGSQINLYLAQTGVSVGGLRQVLYMILLILFGTIVSFIFISRNPPVTVGFGVAIGIAIAALIVYWLRRRRIARFTDQLAPAIDIVVRSLHAGHPFQTAISLVSREMPDPIGTEFGILTDQLTFGAEVEQAMLNMYDRVGAPELNMLMVSVSVQRGTGGNLAEILQNLAQMVRDRLIIKKKVRAISAEGRITAWIMIFFPFGLYLMIKTLVPTYFDPFWESEYSNIVAIGCLIFLGCGMLIIRRLVNFDF